MRLATFGSACIFGVHAFKTHAAIAGALFPGLDEIYDWINLGRGSAFPRKIPGALPSDFSIAPDSVDTFRRTMFRLGSTLQLGCWRPVRAIIPSTLSQSEVISNPRTNSCIQIVRAEKRHAA
jgi:hypothetical protein